VVFRRWLKEGWEFKHRLAELSVHWAVSICASFPDPLNTTGSGPLICRPTVQSTLSAIDGQHDTMNDNSHPSIRRITPVVRLPDLLVRVLAKLEPRELVRHLRPHTEWLGT
jgi:hypothetical protein